MARANKGRWHMGLGPVFVYESIANARRWQVYAGRSVFVLVLLLGLVVTWCIVIMSSTTVPGAGGLALGIWRRWARGSSMH